MLQEAFDSLILSTVNCLQNGEVVIYPTESMFGLGCDPFNKEAVSSLLNLKQRSESSGLILIASDWSQIEKLVQPISQDQYNEVIKSWPGNITWLFTKSQLIPDWISGEHSTVAIRIPDHHAARRLCELFDGPIVSTSANVSGQSPCKSLQEVYSRFSLEDVGYILPIEEGGYDSPSVIRDLNSGKIVR